MRIFLIILFLFLGTEAIETTLGGMQLLCFSYNVTEIKISPLKLTFMCSCVGENEKNIEILIKNYENIPLFHENQISHILKDFNVTSIGLYHLCVKNLDNHDKRITFFITNDEILKDSNVEIQALENLQKLLNQVIFSIKKIFASGEMVNEVSQNHMALLFNKLKMLKKCMIIKLFVFLIIGFIEYNIIKAMILKRNQEMI